MEFTTQVQVNVTGGHLTKSGSGTTTLKWHLETHARERGIVGFTIIIPDQKVKLFLTRYNEETDEEESVTEEMELKDVEVESHHEGHSDFLKRFAGGLMPRELEIWNKQIRLSF